MPGFKPWTLPAASHWANHWAMTTWHKIETENKSEPKFTVLETFFLAVLFFSEWCTILTRLICVQVQIQRFCSWWSQMPRTKKREKQSEKPGTTHFVFRIKNWLEFKNLQNETKNIFTKFKIFSVAIFGDLSWIWLLLTPFGYQNFLFGYLAILATFEKY